MGGPRFTGVHHVVLSVTDLDRSVHWYADVLGFKLLFPLDTEDFERRLMGHPSGVVIGLTQHRSTRADESFNETLPGLDHLAFGVQAVTDLDAWVARLDDAGVEHSGIKVSPATGFTLIAFRDPDDIQLEFYLA